MNIARLIASYFYSEATIALILGNQPWVGAGSRLCFSEGISKKHKLIFHTARLTENDWHYYTVIALPQFDGTVKVRVLGGVYDERDTVENMYTEFFNAPCRALATALENDTYDSYTDFREIEKELVAAEETALENAVLAIAS